MVVTVWGKDGAALNPWLAAYDKFGRKIAGEVISADGVTTSGLGYPLVSEPLHLGRTRGVSNVRTEVVATVGLESGRLLLIETPVTVDS